MIADRTRLKELGLQVFFKYFDNIESQYLNLIYDPNFDRVMERWEYEKFSGLVEWRCAICGEQIFVDKSKYDVENFVCPRCREKHNSKSPVVDRRIMDSRTRLFKYIEDRLYQELEDKLKGGKS